MRALIWTITAIGVVIAVTAATAQTYDSNYPVCLQVYAPEGGYIDCSYTSMPQCNATASGRGAQCSLNPYFAPCGRPPRR